MKKATKSQKAKKSTEIFESEIIKRNPSSDYRIVELSDGTFDIELSKDGIFNPIRNEVDAIQARRWLDNNDFEQTFPYNVIYLNGTITILY